jgi:hypothetical protein
MTVIGANVGVLSEALLARTLPANRLKLEKGRKQPVGRQHLCGPCFR